MRCLPTLMVSGIALLILFSGCTSLIVRDDDNAVMVTGKVVSRLGLGVLTYGMSELAIAQIKQQEAFQVRWNGLTPEERLAWVRQQEAACNLTMDLQPSPASPGLILQEPPFPVDPQLDVASCMHAPPRLVVLGPQYRYPPRLGYWPFRHHGRRR